MATCGELHGFRRLYVLWLIGVISETDMSTLDSIIGENQLLDTNDPIEFEKQLVEVQDSNKITERFREYTSNR